MAALRAPAVAAAVVVAVAAACGSASPAGQATDGPGSSGAATGAPSSAPTTVPTGAPGDGWTRIELARPARASAVVRAVEVTPEGFVAVGRIQCTYAPASAMDPVDCHGLLWRSENGTDWVALPPMDATRVGLSVPMSGPEPGFYAAGGGPDGTAVLGYADDGTGVRAAVWLMRGLEAERIDAGVFGRVDWGAVTASPDRYVAVGTLVEGTTPRGAAWWSDDGRTWTRASDGAEWAIGGYRDTMEYPGFGGPDDVAWTGAQFVAVGSACDESGGSCTAAAWVSDDGASWSRAPGLSGDGRLSTVAAGPAGLVAGGQTCAPTCVGTLATSPNGATWTTTVIDGPPISGVAASAGGFLAVGRVEGLIEGPNPFPILAWVQAGGAAWEPLVIPMPAGIMATGEVDAATARGRTVVTVWIEDATPNSPYTWALSGPEVP